MPQNTKSCGIRVLSENGFLFYLCSSSNVCTILSAVCPSQRSGKSPFAILLYSAYQGRLLRFQGLPPLAGLCRLSLFRDVLHTYLMSYRGFLKSSFFRYVTRICNETLGMAH